MHAFTSTWLRLLHGAMLGVWRKTLMPHRNRQRKTLQPKKAAANNCHLVEIPKPLSPHKEQK
jgi:hypothetical protein